MALAILSSGRLLIDTAKILQVVRDYTSLFHLQDTRTYAAFEIRPYHGVVMVARLRAYDSEYQEMRLPTGIKMLYLTWEAARDVQALLTRLFLHKTCEECEALLGIREVGHAPGQLGRVL